MAKTGERVTKSEKKERGTVRRIAKILLVAAALFVVLSVVSAVIYPYVCFGRCDGNTAFSLTYADIDGAAYPREPFEFKSGKNTLRGYLYLPEDPKGLVVVVNGIKNGADVHLPHIEAFYDDGWAVATYDATGVGRSDGGGTVGLSQVKVDLFAFFEYLKGDEYLSTLPTVLFGHSAGGYAAACAVGEDSRVAGAICISSFDRPTETMIYHGRRVVGFFADLEYPLLALSVASLCGPDADAPAHEAVAASSVPVMIVESSSDDTVPYEIGLLRYRDEFDLNPNVSYYSTDDGSRNEHSTVWLTEEAAEYVNSFGGGEVDRQRANELDPEFLAIVLDFMNSAIKK